MKRKTQGKIWGYCFECGKALTEEMEENIDWHDVRSNGESLPLCSACLYKHEKENGIFE